MRGMDYAMPQTLAKIQDEQAERDFNRRVKEANLAAYESAREANANRRGGSVSRIDLGPDGDVQSFSNTVIGPDGSVSREGWGDFDSQARIGSEFADLARRSAAVRQHNARIGADSMNAAMRAAMSNGGRLPQNAVDMLSRNLGLDGRTSAVYGAGFLNNGDFDIDIVTKGANGALQRTTKKITPLEQYNMMLAAPGVWGEDGVAVSQGLYNRLRNTRGKSELQAPSVYADNLRAYNTQKQSADTMKMMTGLYQAVYKDMSKGGKQPVTTDVIRARMASDLLKDKNIGLQITSVPDLNSDGTQKMVEDENGNQVPAMRQADPNNPDDVERVKQNIKMRLDLVPELAQRQDAQGGGDVDRRLAFLKYIYDRENPPTPPDVLAFQQRQRGRQMRQVEEAQARADITQRPQQVINYIRDGKWYSGNGYVRDGKVYDGNGYEISGATPVDMARGEDGRLVQDGRGGFAVRALPSAKELVGGNVGGGAGQGGGQPAKQAQAGQQTREYTPEERAMAAERLKRREARKAFSTKLPEEDEAKFLEWERSLPTSLYNLGDTVDLRGYWKDPGTPKNPDDINRLLDDPKSEAGAFFSKLVRRYHKPNNSEFSTESIHVNDQNRDMAGTFGEDGKYIPSDARMERDATQKELNLIRAIQKTGSVVKPLPNGTYEVSIAGYDRLPDDSIYRVDMDENGVYRTDSLEDALRASNAALKAVLARKKERRDIASKYKAEEARLKREALRRYPTNSTKREKDVREGLEKWSMENDPKYRKKKEEKKAEKSLSYFYDNMAGV